MKTNAATSRISTTWITAFLTILFVCMNISAQGDGATIRGTVVDQNGAVVAGAKVIVTNEAKAIKRETVTDADGNFTVVLLPPETYRIRCEVTGFGPAEMTEIKLNANDQRQLKLELKPRQIIR
jgi:uncharacterized membrane protein